MLLPTFTSALTLSFLCSLAFASPANITDSSPHAVYPSADGLPVTDSSLGIVNTTNASPPTGPFSQGIVVGDFVFVSGQLPLDIVTGAPVGFEGNGNITIQTNTVLANIKGIVEASGSSIGKIVSCRVFLKNITDFDAMNAAYAAFFGHHKPARATVAVAALSKNSLIEVEAIAKL